MVAASMSDPSNNIASPQEIDTHSSNNVSQQMGTQSRQSLINRNTSPWVNHNQYSRSNSIKDQPDNTESGSINLREPNQRINLIQIADRHHNPRDLSLGSNDSNFNSSSLPFNENNFLTMQRKITQQAQRLMQFKSQQEELMQRNQQLEESLAAQP
jgi:hypothetical protein